MVKYQNRKEETILGVVYGNQESKTKIDDSKSLIDKIDYYAVKAKNEDKFILVIGDFNVKIGGAVKGKHTQ